MPGLDSVQTAVYISGAPGLRAVRQSNQAAVRKELFQQLRVHFVDVVASAKQGAKCHGADHSHGMHLHLTRHLRMAGATPMRIDCNQRSCEESVLTGMEAESNYQNLPPTLMILISA